MGTWLFAFTAASALVIASGHAAAVDADGDRIDDELELAAERSVAFRGSPTVDPLSMRVSSQSVGTPTHDWFRVKYEGGEFDVEYFRESEVSLVTSSFSLEVRSILEWSDSSGDGLLQRGEILATHALGSSAFGLVPLEHSEVVSDDGGAVHTITIRSDRNEVTMVLTIAQRFYRVSPTRVLTPMEMKIDLTISQRVENPGARIALELRVDTDDSLHYEATSWASANGFSRDESAVNVTSGAGPDAAAVFFSWPNAAMVDGRMGSVGMSTPEAEYEEGSYGMFLAYPAGLNPIQPFVRHAPSVGVVSAAYGSILNPPPGDFQPDVVVYGASAAGFAALVAVTMISAKRRRRKE